jgi:uncharacterized protein (DUF3820 family)
MTAKTVKEIVKEAITNRGWTESEADQMISRIANGGGDSPPESTMMMPIGKHKGELIQDILIDDPQYLHWLVAQDWTEENYPLLFEEINRVLTGYYGVT